MWVCHQRRGAFFRSLAFVLLLGVSPAALAQEVEDEIDAAAMADAPPPPQPLSGISLNDNVPPLRRRRAATDDDKGLRLGSFIASPSLEVGVIGSSNAGREAKKTNEDAAVYLRPSLKLSSDWSRHSVSLDASADIVRYLDSGELDSNGIDIGAATRIDLRRTTQVELDAAYQLLSLAPSDIATLGSPIENQDTHRFTGGAGLTHDFGGATGRLRLTGTRQTYDDVRLNDGTTELNGDRDYVEGQIALRATLNTAAHIRPFAEVAYAQRWHDQKIDRNGLGRDSHGVTGTIGLVLEDDPFWSGELALRSVLRDYVSPSFNTQTALGAFGALQWQPRDGTALGLSAGVDISDSISATEGGERSWNFSSNIRQAVRNNIDLTGSAAITLTETLTGTDKAYNLSAGAEWAINPMITGRIGYEGNWLDAAAVGDDADEHRILASIILAR